MSLSVLEAAGVKAALPETATRCIVRSQDADFCSLGEGRGSGWVCSKALTFHVCCRYYYLLDHGKDSVDENGGQVEHAGSAGL